MSECELLNTCGFFKKYENTLNLACRGFIKSYCRGPMMESCMRKKFRAEHGFPPDPDMLPTGQLLPSDYRQD